MRSLSLIEPFENLYMNLSRDDGGNNPNPNPNPNPLSLTIISGAEDRRCQFAFILLDMCLYDFNELGSKSMFCLNLTLTLTL